MSTDHNYLQNDYLQNNNSKTKCNTEIKFSMKI